MRVLLKAGHWPTERSNTFNTRWRKWVPLNVTAYTMRARSRSIPRSWSALSLGQPAPVRTHFASVVRERSGSGAVRGKTKSAGQRKHLYSKAGFDLFADHPASLHVGSYAAGCHLQCAKSDDRRCFEAKDRKSTRLNSSHIRI